MRQQLHIESYRFPLPTLPVWVAFGILIFFSSVGFADDTRPRVLVLYDAADGIAPTSEPKLVTEIALAVDQYEVMPISLPDPAFSNQSFEQQLETLRSLARTYHASYSIWVTSPPSGPAVLFLCTLLPKRTFLRTVEIQRTADVEKDVAVAARELLEEISFTVEAPAAPIETPAAEPIEKPIEKPAFQSFFEIEISARGTFGVVGQEGPASMPGAGLGFRWHAVPQLYLQAAMTLDFGPYRQTSEESISGITPAPKLGIGYLKKWSAISLGPLLEFQESWTRLKISAPKSDTQTYTWWHFRVGIGMGLGISIRQKSALVLDASLGISPVRETIRRESDASTRLITPLLDIRVGLSFLLTP